MTGDLTALTSRFDDMIDHCYDYVETARNEGRPVVGIMCEFTPREIIMAAGAVPVCLCGGSADQIPAAEKILPANLCPLIKSTFGYHCEKKNPFLEWADLIVAETTCDAKKKMYEIMGETRPMHILNLPHRPGDGAAFDLWKIELRRFITALEERFKVRITEARLREAIRAMNHERQLRRRLAESMKHDQPPLTGRRLLDLKSIVSCIPDDIECYKKILGAMEANRQNGGSSPADRRVRVLLTGVPVVHGAERVFDIIENRGGLVVCQENCTGLKPILDDVDENAADPVEALAEKYYTLPCSIMSPNNGRFVNLRRLADEYSAECVIELVWQACLTYDVETVRVKALCAGELALPYLNIQTDYSPADSARIAVRVEALFETVISRRAAAA